MSNIGKNQTFSRQINTELVLELIRERPYSGTELADKLSLSNATVSSIIKDLAEIGIIRVNEATSITGLGRKRINYEINPNYGLILGVNISNFHAIVSLIDAKENLIACGDVQVNKYDRHAMYDLVLESSKLLISENKENVKLRCIVITLPGRVNSKTGELVLSVQFDKELFSESHMIQNLFNKQFPDVPVLLANDNNVMSIGELYNGDLKNVNNGIYFNIDWGIGGGIIIDNKLFDGNLGYAGEFGLIKYYDGHSFKEIDEFVSLRALCLKASEILGHEVDRVELLEQYNQNQKIKDMVLESAQIVSSVIRQIIEVLDVSDVVISGRVSNFGDEYIKRIQDGCASDVRKIEVSFSTLGNKAVIYGTSFIGLRHMFENLIIKK